MASLGAVSQHLLLTANGIQEIGCQALKHLAFLWRFHVCSVLLNVMWPETALSKVTYPENTCCLSVVSLNHCWVWDHTSNCVWEGTLCAFR